MLSAGELRHRVTVQSIPEVDDGHDGFTDGPPVSVHSRIPARVKPLRGVELERARQIDPRLSHEITLRYWRGYTEDLAGGRVELIYHDDDDRTFEIVGPPLDVDEAHVMLQLSCREAA